MASADITVNPAKTEFSTVKHSHTVVEVTLEGGHFTVRRSSTPVLPPDSEEGKETMSWIKMDRDCSTGQGQAP